VTLDRRQFLSAGLAAAAGAAIASGGRTLAATPDNAAGKIGATARKRNVLLIVSDDHGYDMSCVGSKVRTPALDALAREGVLFTVLADLRKQLDTWRTATHDPWQKGVTDPLGRAH
jgi:N-sulfoglucosamine sulfohydrolase